jgi:EAL domain-containing protein (putative c-di-GMP-specific phosphodiesterase class I)
MRMLTGFINEGRMSHQHVMRIAPHIEEVILPKFSIAFQPIVDVQEKTIFAFEALLRGPQGETYADLAAGLGSRARRMLDHSAIVKSLRIASNKPEEWAGKKLCINITPRVKGAVKEAEFVRKTADRFNIAPSQIVLELTEDVKGNSMHLRHFLETHQAHGFSTAIDDFGSGYAGICMLADCVPDVLKLDRCLTKGIDRSVNRQKIIRSFCMLCESLGVKMIAEGVETAEELASLQSLGIRFMQGYYFAKPEVEMFGKVRWQAVPTRHRSLSTVLNHAFRSLRSMTPDVQAGTS